MFLTFNTERPKPDEIMRYAGLCAARRKGWRKGFFARRTSAALSGGHVDDAAGNVVDELGRFRGETDELLAPRCWDISQESLWNNLDLASNLGGPETHALSTSRPKRIRVLGTEQAMNASRKSTARTSKRRALRRFCMTSTKRAMEKSSSRCAGTTRIRKLDERWRKNSSAARQRPAALARDVFGDEHNAIAMARRAKANDVT